MKKYIYRVFRYIFKGIPNIEIKKNIIQINSENQLKDKKILITGGNRGLGYSIAKKCIDNGALVYIIGRNEKELKKAKEELGKNCEYFVFDMLNIEKLDKLISYINSKDIDCLINNAGISLHEVDSFHVTIDNWDIQFNVNLKAVYFLSIEFAKSLINRKKSGNIINMVSERGLYCDDLPYGLTKSALISFTQGFSRRMIKHNININAIAPGVTATDMTGYKENENLYSEYTCGNRIFLPQEVSELAVFLLSDASNCISGEVIACDQGNYLRCDW